MGCKSNRSWLGAVFGMIFVVGGLAAAYGTAGNIIIGYVASANWVEVQATIHEVNLVSHRGETSTYSVESRYSYFFNGSNYESDQVSLSSGSDNFGTYWHDLERTLRQSQVTNEAIALVNPKNPSQSLLDRTFRWNSIIFGTVFLMIFGGIGGFITWASLRGTKKREVRLVEEQKQGISSDQKAGSWGLAAVGGVFLVFGGGMSLLVLPSAISKGQYGALLVLVFVLVGVGIIWQAYRIRRAYKRFGSTPLRLDPLVPGVGGQLGGKFSMNVPGIGQNSASNVMLKARLTCTRSSKSGKSTSYVVKWQEHTPVYLTETANGVDASFLFEIPDHCKPSKEWSRGSSIKWNVTVEGEFRAAGLGKFERRWQVVVEESPAQASNVLNVPESFIQDANQQHDELAKQSALDQLPVVEDSQYINVHSRAGREVGAKTLGFLIGVLFAGVGIFTILNNWLPGYIFLLVGIIISVISLFILGKSIHSVIDKESHMLYTRESLYGFVYAQRQGELFDPCQFKIHKTSSSNSYDKVTEYYAVNFESDGKTIRIADGIKGKKEALAVIDEIVSRYFNEDQESLAA